MKLRQLCLTAALLLTALTLPAQALEYNVEALDGGLFGRPTTDDTVYVNKEPVNQDRSKNNALVAPAFGSPTSYLPGSGEYLTPSLADDTDSTSGGAVGSWTAIGGGSNPADAVPPAQVTPSPDFTITCPTAAFTEVTSDLYYSAGHLGTLKIPAIDLSVRIYEGTGSKPLSKGAGHFEDASIWDGNVCLAGHNRGVTNHFGRIHTLEIGDRLTLTTRLGTRTYEVVCVAQVSETDRNGLAATADNRVTLYTCVRDQRDLRWMVQAVEV